MNNRRSFADVFTQSLIDTTVSLTENGHFTIVLLLETQWWDFSLNAKWTTDSENHFTLWGANDASYEILMLAFIRNLILNWIVTPVAEEVGLLNR